MKPLKTFETSRLILKPTSVEDAGFILKLLNTPKWIKFVGDRKVYTEDEARAYIKARMLPQQERLGFSHYTIFRKADNIAVGGCGLFDREGVEGIDIGFAFLPQFENLGYGYESSTELMRAAVEDFNINYIKAITTKDNTASQKLLAKLGLACVGTVTLPGDSEELLLYQVQL